MDEEFLASVLAATFRGTNDEIKIATDVLISCFEDPFFFIVLFSIIKKPKYDISIRQSACIQIFRIISNELILPDAFTPFCQEFTSVIEECGKELSPILKKCSNEFITFLNNKSIDPSSIIFELISIHK